MELTYYNGCTSVMLEIDGKDCVDIPDAEITKILRKAVGKTKPEHARHLLGLLVELEGELTESRICDQCGDIITQYEWEI